MFLVMRHSSILSSSLGQNSVLHIILSRGYCDDKCSDETQLDLFYPHPQGIIQSLYNCMGIYIVMTNVVMRQGWIYFIIISRAKFR